MLNCYAEIIVNNDAIQVDRPFTYIVNEDHIDLLRIGHRVKVPFGMGNKLIEGFVINIKTEINGKFSKMKAISQICDKDPILTFNDIELMNFLRQKYLCKYIEALRVMIPTGILNGNKPKIKKVVVFKKDLTEEYFKANYIKVMEVVKENNGVYSKTELCDKFNLSLYSINKLVENEFLIIDDECIQRIDNRNFDLYKSRNLNEEQLRAINRIVYGKENIYLLKGVTGSGKTEVYMNLAAKMLSENKSTLILVPEISLTPQMIERFKGRFGKDVAVFHSRLSNGERFDEWYRVKSGKVKLVVGARSAIFLPFTNLGLVVIDEEHEATYKSEQNPKYNTIEVAEFKSLLDGCKVVLGSATPSMESYYRTQIKEIVLIEMHNRVDNQPMPIMKIIDMREELNKNNKSMFSEELYNSILDRLNKKEQIIIFLNRRGYSTFVSCRKCGYVFKCDHCDIAMTYHTNGYLVCHYCGATKKQVNTCPSCNSKYVKFFGAGTERIEEYIKNIFPQARVLRMDVDTTRKKNSHEEIYRIFKNGEADILIGTQMISKGLDFPNVTLVGVISADVTLNLPDYRAGERTYQIITQVAGRAGRGKKEGLVIVQTYTPDHYSLIHASNYDFESFFKEELQLRKIMNYPPFTKIFLLNMSSKHEGMLKTHISKVGENLKRVFENENVEFLGPCPCVIQKINEFYRYQIIIKGNFGDIVAQNAKDVIYDLSNDVYNDIKINIDLNPNNLA